MKPENTTANCSSTFQQYLLPPIYGVEFFVAVVGNLMALCLLVTKERKNWHTGVVFSCNLVISDILYALTLPFLIVYYSKDHIWNFGNTLCKMERFLFTCNLYASIYFIMCISVNRYLAIVYPFFTRKHVRPKHAKIASVLVWISVAIMSSPILYFSGLSEKKGSAQERKCSLFQGDQKSNKFHYRLCMAVIGCLIPFVVTIASYFGVIWVVVKNKNISRLEKQKVTLIVAVVCILYTMSFGPYHILQIWHFWLKEVKQKNCSVTNAYQVSKALACLNMCLHPILYMAVFDSIRRVCCRKCSDEPNGSNVLMHAQ